MEQAKKIELLEEMLEVDEGTIKPETKLDDIREWDSMAKLSLIAMVDEEFGKVLNGNDIKALVTVDDVLKIME